MVDEHRCLLVICDQDVRFNLLLHKRPFSRNFNAFLRGHHDCFEYEIAQVNPTHIIVLEYEESKAHPCPAQKSWAKLIEMGYKDRAVMIRVGSTGHDSDDYISTWHDDLPFWQRLLLALGVS